LLDEVVNVFSWRYTNIVMKLRQLIVEI